MSPLILLIQSNQVTSREKHTMEKQVTKDGSGSDTESEKEPDPGAAKKTELVMKETSKN